MPVIASVALAAGSGWGHYAEPRMIGAIGLIITLAGVVGIAVYRLASRFFRGGAYELGLFAAFGTVAGLAYLGVEAAGAIMWVVLGLVLVAWLISALTQFL